MAILKVRNPKNEWEAVTDIEFNSIRLSDENTTIKLKANLDADGKYRLSISDTEDKNKEILAYKSELTNLGKEFDQLTEDINEKIDNFKKNYHPSTIDSIKNNKIIPDKEYNEYSLKNITSLTIDGSKFKRAHGFISFKSGHKPNASYEGGQWKVSGGNFEDANNGGTWEFDIYPHNGTNYIIWKNWDLVE